MDVGFAKMLFNYHILFFADRLYPAIGGMEVHAHYFQQHFGNHKHFPLIATITKTTSGRDALIMNNLSQEIDITAITDYVTPKIIFFNSGKWIEELHIIRELYPKAILCYRTGGNEIIKAPLAKQFISSHKARQEFWSKSINDCIDLLITNSAFTEIRLRDVGVKTDFFRCIGGVNCEPFNARPAFQKSAEINLFTAARFVPYKNHALLLEVVRVLVGRGYKVYLEIAGDGPLLPEMQALTIQYGIKDNINFIGAISNDAVCSKIAHADFYIQLSYDYKTQVPGGYYVHAEGMGRSILEAISAGTYVIAGNSGALNEIITENLGLILNPGSADAIADQLEPVLKTHPRKLSGTTKYSWEKLFQRYEIKFNELCAL